MNKFTKITATALITLMLTSCAEQGGPMTKQQAGTGLGAVGGALLGSQVGKGEGRLVGAAVGALAGAAIGSSVGASLDRVDMQYMQSSQQKAFETYKTGQSSEWRNPDSGNSGTITPTRTYTDNGRYCREYTQTIKVGGKTQEGYGTACRQPDGTWKVMD